MKKLSISIVFCLLFAAAVCAQNPVPTPPPEEDDNVVKISTTLIQIDVTVLDKNGRQITDLKPEDFEVLENGKVQDITNFSYVAVTPDVKKEVQAQQTTSNSKQIRIPPVPLRLKPEQVRRTIVLVVDDLTLSLGSMDATRDALEKFVNEQMLPNDLVAIIQTSRGISSLQQFTSDKRILLRAIEKVYWRPGFASIGIFEPIRPTTGDFLKGNVNAQGGVRSAPLGGQQNEDNERVAGDTRRNMFVAGSLGAIKYAVQGMRELPGRKSIVLFSDGFRVVPSNEKEKNASFSIVEKAMKSLVDEASRAGVIINTIDARGLEPAGMFYAEDNTLGKDIMALDAIQQSRINDFRDSQSGLSYLSNETGGRFYKNINYLDKAVQKFLDDQSGYYLLGYQPSDETFDADKRKFNRLEIRVKRPDTRVRYRSGFFNITDEELNPKTVQTPGQKMLAALFSPLGASGINMRLTSIFANDIKEGNYIRALMHLDTRDIKFTDEPNGNKKASVEVVAFTMGEEGKVIGNLARTYTFNIKQSEYRRVLDKGLVYSMVVPVKKAGGYQLRMVVRDNATNNIGAANQFVEVPNLGSDRMALSGIFLQNLTEQQWQAQLAAQKAAVSSSPAADIPDVQTVTATRAFRRGTILFYSYTIYNPKLVAGQARIESQARLYRDGELVFEGALSPVSTQGQNDPKRISADGAVTLGSKLTPGNYVLQIVVLDNNAKEKNQIQAQWMDFEIVE